MPHSAPWNWRKQVLSQQWMTPWWSSLPMPPLSAQSQSPTLNKATRFIGTFCHFRRHHGVSAKWLLLVSSSSCASLSVGGCSRVRWQGQAENAQCMTQHKFRHRLRTFFSVWFALVRGHFFLLLWFTRWRSVLDKRSRRWFVCKLYTITLAPRSTFRAVNGPRRLARRRLNESHRHVTIPCFVCKATSRMWSTREVFGAIWGINFTLSPSRRITVGSAMSRMLFFVFSEGEDPSGYTFSA